MSRFKNIDIDDFSSRLSMAQIGAFRRIVDILDDDSVTNCIVLPAGAGAGKTHLMSNLISGFIKFGVKPEHINSISFTNLSADEIQHRVLKNQKDILGGYYNMGFGTIHTHALNTLQSLKPHMNGFMAPVTEDVFGQSEQDKRSQLLSWMASLKTGMKNAEFKPFMTEENLKFELIDFTEDDIERYFNNGSYIGMDAFINEDMDVSYPISVAAECLCRIYDENIMGVRDGNYEDIRKLGIPEILVIDEAQDVDISQMLYARALTLCGTNIVMVGDHSQSLYRWRNGLSDLVFNDKFMGSIFNSMNILNDTPLNENYRSRSQILDINHEVSDKILTVAKDQEMADFFTFNEHTPDMHPMNAMRRSDKKSVCVLMSNKPVETVQDINLLKTKSNLETNSEWLNKYKKYNSGRYYRLFKSRNFHGIIKWFNEMEKRVADGESVAVITNDNAQLIDIELIRTLTHNKVPVVKVSSEKCVALSSYETVSINGSNDMSIRSGVPISHLMVSAAIHFLIADTEDGSDIFHEFEFEKSMQNNREKIKKDEQLRYVIYSHVEYFMKKFYKAKTRNPNYNPPEKEFYNEGMIKSICYFISTVLANYGSICAVEKNTDAIRLPYRMSGISIITKGMTNTLRPAREQIKLWNALWTAITITEFEHGRGADRTQNDIIDNNLTILNIGVATAQLWNKKENLQLNSNFTNDLVKSRENAIEAMYTIFTSSVRKWIDFMFRSVNSINLKNIPLDQAVFNVYKDCFENDNDLRNKLGISSDKLMDTMVFDNNSNIMKRNVTRIEGSIELSTVHASKGMEWDHVLYITNDYYPRNESPLCHSHHASVYVTLTRARDTLTIAIPDKTKHSFKDTRNYCDIVDTSIYQVGLKHGLIACDISGLEFDDEKKDRQHVLTDIIHAETSHSELEVSMTCGMSYDIKYRRGLKASSFMSSIGYPLFFHSFMSELIADLTGQRFIYNDMVARISNIIQYNILAEGNMNDENIIRQILTQNCETDFMDLITGMIPIYQYGIESDEYSNIQDYYTRGLIAHLSSIIYGSNLFHDVIRSNKERNSKVIIEKNMRGIMEKDGNILPFQGIPDVMFVFDDTTNVYDYKSVPGGNHKHMQKRMSDNVAMQLNIYMGLHDNGFGINKNYYAEAIYVMQLDLRNAIKKDQEILRLGILNGNNVFGKGKETEHARILSSHRYNRDAFSLTGGIMLDTKEKAEQQTLNLVDSSLRPDKPLCSKNPVTNEDNNEVVKKMECFSCNNRSVCYKNHFNHIYSQN